MLKFINSLAIIEINEEIDAVQITFRGTGSAREYSETLGMAASFANMHRLSSFLLIKEQFEDLSETYFQTIVQHWLSLLLKRSPEEVSKVRVAVLAGAETDTIHPCHDNTPYLAQATPTPAGSLAYHTNYAQACLFLRLPAACEKRYITK